MNEVIRAYYSIDNVVDFGGIKFGIDGEGNFTGIRIVGYGVGTSPRPSPKEREKLLTSD